MLDSLQIRSNSDSGLTYDVLVNGAKLNHVQSVSLNMSAMCIPEATIKFWPGRIISDIPQAVITKEEAQP